ncbi:MAG: DUF4097 domain-containing protein [Oscillospiraceae bacterium]|nr:DUF4097 domain-containing protein [Oscillospiraceae bacterium]
MSRTKKWIIAAAILVAVGGVIFLGALAAVGFDVSNLSTWQYETSIYEITDDVENILIDTEISEVIILPSDDGICKVVCYDDDTLKHTVEVENDTLSIMSVSTRKWYNYIGIFTGSPSVTVYLPKEAYVSLTVTEEMGDIELSSFDFEVITFEVDTGDVILEEITCESLTATVTMGDISLSNVVVNEDLSGVTDTGDITLEAITCENLTATVIMGDIALGNVIVNETLSATTDTGDVTFDKITCDNLVATATMGDISLESVIATEVLSASTDTGDICLDGSDAGEMSLETTLGDIEGTILSGKIFVVSTELGDISVPETISGGICRATVEIGDIKLEIE